jgi:hypothetical protein
MESRRANAAGISLPLEHVAEVRTLVGCLGMVGAAQELGVAREVIARALAGLGLRRATVERIAEHFAATTLAGIGASGTESAPRPSLRKARSGR